MWYFPKNQGMVRGLWLLLCLGMACGPAKEGQPQDALPTMSSRMIENETGDEDPNKAKLLAAYPSYLSHFEGNELVWRDGTRMVWDDGKSKTLEELLDGPDLQDMFEQAYPDKVIFQVDYDPGRCRPDAFFMKVYGGSAAAVEAQLVPVEWFGQMLRFNKANGAAKALEAVRDELMPLKDLHGYLQPSAGTFNWRVVAGTKRLSNHSFGIAIDLNVQHAHYWRWSKEFKAGQTLRYQNSIPIRIVEAFERHGFIWGGKWYHYDTMHFEYRPELL